MASSVRKKRKQRKLRVSKILHCGEGWNLIYYFAQSVSFFFAPSSSVILGCLQISELP